jgi:hypothetical protein
MIHHIVCLRFKPGTNVEQIAAAGAALESMQARIPEIRSVRWGLNLAPSTGEYSHVLTVVLDDMAAVERYLTHPYHQAVLMEHLAPIREARLALDIEA